MDEVKNEIFGSRKSKIESFFIQKNINYISNIWIVTCRKKLNNDNATRYLLIAEGGIADDYYPLVNISNQNITAIHVVFDKYNMTVEVQNLRTKKTGILTYNLFKERIIGTTNCKYIHSKALGSKESTPLSRFFRERMGKGFALTDIDFFLIKKKIFIEEKNFIIDNKGYIGVGQSISFKEVIRDIFTNIDFYIICITDGICYIGRLNNIDTKNIKILKDWGKMIPVKVKKIDKYNLQKFLSR